MQPQAVAGDGPAPVFVELVVGDHDAGCRFRADPSVGQSGALRWQIGRLLDDVAGVGP